MDLKTQEDFLKKLKAYPNHVRPKMELLRQLVHEAAIEIPGLLVLEECLRWNEPSFVTKSGSTFRMDWKSANPSQYALYFQCTSSLVETFRLVFGNIFQYEGNRALIFDLNQELPEKELRSCITACLNYHRVKGKPFLGL